MRRFIRQGRRMLALALAVTLVCCLLCACQTDNSLSQTAQPEKSPQQVLDEHPIDDTHDAFLVDTQGKLGTLLVTTELDRTPTKDCDFILHMLVD